MKSNVDGLTVESMRGELSAGEKVSLLITSPPIIFLVSPRNEARCPTFLNSGSNSRKCSKGLVFSLGLLFVLHLSDV